MSLDGSWVPETEEEDMLMEDLHIATRRANRRGVSKERIAALLAFMASASLDPKADQESPRETESAMEKAMEPEEVPECPDCGSPAEDILMSIGGNLRVQPCGCDVAMEDAAPLGSLLDDEVLDQIEEDE